MRFSRLRRGLAWGLMSVLLLTNSAAALAGGFTYTYPIGLGTTYARQDGYNANGLQKASIITYSPNASVSPIGVRSGDQFYGSRKSISQVSASLEASGRHVIGGINADFFSFSDGVPTGLFADNGRVIASTDWQSAVGFMPDGTAIIGDPISDIVISGESGKIAVFDYNKTRTARGLCLLDQYYSNETHFGSPGQSVIMEYDDFSTLKIGQPISLTVVDKKAGSTSFPIGKNQMVLSRRDDCTSMPWVDFKIGERVTITLSTNDPRWGDILYGVGGKKLISNGVVTTNGIDSGSSMVARSAVGIKSNGAVVLYEVDGLQPDYSKGLTAKQLADELASLGCVSAIALDGGGSSALTIRNPAADASKTITRPSEGSERRCSTYIFLVNHAKKDDTPAYLHLEPVSRYVLPGGTVSFSTTVLDGGFHKTISPLEITYDAAAGSVANGQYTAPLTPGAVKVSATADEVTGSMDLFVTNEPTAMSLLKSGKAVSSLSMQAGDIAQIDAMISRNGVAVTSANSQMVWSTSGGIGSISKSGEFTAARAGTGQITASCYGVSRSVSVTVGMGQPQGLLRIADFEDKQPLRAAEGTTLTLTKDLKDVARGYQSLQVAYSGNDAEVLTPETDVTNKQVLTLWAKLSSGTADLSAAFKDANGNEIVVPFDLSVQNVYRQLRCSVPQEAKTFVGLRMSRASKSTTLLLDHIILSEYAVTNLDTPNITITDSRVEVREGESAYVTAKITQAAGTSPLRSEQVRAYIDGALSPATYKPASAAIDIKTSVLSAGTHIILLEAEDDAGNINRKSITVTAGIRTGGKFSDISTSWASGYINLLSDRKVMSGEQLSDATFRFYPDNNLRRSEFAVLMARVLGLAPASSTTLPFSDTDSLPSWAKPSIAAVTQAGIMTGQVNPNTGENRFNANAEITRAEVMSVLARCLPRGYVVKPISFTDATSIPSWAQDAVAYVTSAGIIKGYTDGSIKSNAKITRAEIASVICNFS